MPGEVRHHGAPRVRAGAAPPRARSRRPGRRRSRAAPPRRSRSRPAAGRGAGAGRRGRRARRRARSCGSYARSGARSGSSPLGTYGRFAHTTAYGGSTWYGRRSAATKTIRSATPWPTAFSRASCRASSDTSIAITITCSAIFRRRSAASTDTAIAPVPVPTSTTRSVGAPGGRGVAVEPVDDLRDRASTSSSVSGRGISARRIGREGEAVELAEAADVGDGLPALAPGDRGLERLARVRADRGVGMGEDARSGRCPASGRAAAPRRAARESGARGGDALGGACGRARIR